jgi:phosphoribosylaminoimidazolecarboxamide formyltransferase/IMP cyclohydrolase
MSPDLITIKRALISLSDKTNIKLIVDIVKKYNIEVLSTGGTAKLLREHGITVKDVSDYTNFPEMLDGRVKTLHPKIHGGLLGRYNLTAHKNEMKQRLLLHIQIFYWLNLEN